MQYIDAHCHLSDNVDLDAVLTRASECGVRRLCCNAAQFSDWNHIVSMVRHYPQVCGAIGVHPWYISSVPNNWLERLQTLLAENPDLMIGEIGLDKNRPDITTQQDMFIAQLHMAHKMGRGVSVHCVGMWDLLFRILHTHCDTLPRFLILHSYSGPTTDMEKLSERFNLYYSYGPRSIRARRFADLVLHTPVARILLESDADNPEIIPTVSIAIADKLNLAPAHLADIIYHNTIRILPDGQIA